MDKQKILIHLDGDQPASAFDAIVAIDAGIDHLLTYGGCQPTDVTAIVHGALFTRGPADLKRTAIFIGGSDVAAAALLKQKVAATFFGPFQVSVLCDPNGCNTTASAAVVLAARHVPLAESSALILGGTGPVGSRIAQLLGRQGTRVLIASRTFGRAQTTCQQLASAVGSNFCEPAVCNDTASILRALHSCQLVFAAGAAGVEFLPVGWLDEAPHVQLAADVNAVAPVGLGGISPTDAGHQRGATVCFGALGIGSLKMKLHKQCLRQLFERNDQRLDLDEVFAIGQTLPQ